MRKIFHLLFKLSVFMSISTYGIGSSDTPINTTESNASFTNPVKVTIIGYSGDAQEPHISRDGMTLFFNNLNAGNLPSGQENDTNIHYASRIDDVTFQYIGEVQGANTDEISGVNELEGVASIDKNNKFFFINTIDYLDITSPNYLLSLFEADFVNGALVNIQSIPNLKSSREPGQSIVPGELNFDAEVNYDGNNLYYVEGVFSGNPFPDRADIAIASKEGETFVANPDSKVLFNLINTEHLEYAPSISTDQLELYFSRAVDSASGSYDFGIYVATRNSVLEPWGNIKRLESTNGEFSEGPSISFDGRLLYFHQKISGVFNIFVVERK